MDRCPDKQMETREEGERQGGRRETGRKEGDREEGERPRGRRGTGRREEGETHIRKPMVAEGRKGRMLPSNHH